MAAVGSKVRLVLFGLLQQAVDAVAIMGLVSDLVHHPDELHPMRRVRR
jgi:hypothetical protein